MTWKLDTLAIHAGQPNDPLTGAVSFPIYQTSTFAQDEPGHSRGFDYARTDHPTRRALEENIAALEHAKHGLAFASGMAAINGVIATLEAGDHVVASKDLYGGAWRLFARLWSKFGVAFSFVDATDPDSVHRAIRDETKLLWLETPSNPLLNVCDLRACTAIARGAGVTTVADNTFATPVLQRPLDHGADVVVHSTTKYVNGHSDVVGGAVITSDSAIYERIKFFQNAIGAIPGPQDCFLTLRGTKTLTLRIARHCANAERLAHHLESHPLVRHVYYPGLASHPGHAVARRQMSAFGAIVSFEIDGDAEAVRRFARATRLWTLAESLGGPKSLFCHPATMTHASMDDDARRAAGIGPSLVRLSVGLEDPDDLIDDLDDALEAARVERARRSA